MPIRRRFAALAGLALAATVAVLTLSGCVPTALQTKSEGSRARLYDSVKALADDSVAVVYGTVASQRVATDIDSTPFTISTVTVKAVPKGSGIAPGATVEVRQVGDNTLVGPAPLLSRGDDYLLYLTLTGLPGDLATQHYVTGGEAGLFRASGANSEDGAVQFERMAQDSGDTLPPTLTLAQAQG